MQGRRSHAERKNGVRRGSSRWLGFKLHGGDPMSRFFEGSEVMMVALHGGLGLFRRNW